MIIAAICVLSLGITLVSMLLGASVFHLWVPVMLWQLVLSVFVGGIVVCALVQHLFRRRDSYNPIRWYEFSRDILLGIGTMICFAAGAYLQLDYTLLGCACTVVGFICVTRACIVGPWQGWDVYLGSRAILGWKRYPYPTPPHPGYEYDP